MGTLASLRRRGHTHQMDRAGLLLPDSDSAARMARPTPVAPRLASSARGWHRGQSVCTLGRRGCAASGLGNVDWHGAERGRVSVRTEIRREGLPVFGARNVSAACAGCAPAALAVCPLHSAAGFRAKWDDRGKLLLQLLHCWTWPNLMFWSLVPNHNVRYALPMSPGLMGLGVMGLIGWWQRFNPPTPFPPREGGWGVRFLVAFLACWLLAKIALRAVRDSRAYA